VSFGPGCFVHDRSTIWADASRSVDPVDARGGVGLLSDSERTKCNRESQHNEFHFRMTPGFGHPTDAGYDACATYFSASSIFAKDFKC
jgi:hypothetical protein